MQVQMGQVTRVAFSLVRSQIGCSKVMKFRKFHNSVDVSYQRTQNDVLNNKIRFRLNNNTTVTELVDILRQTKNQLEPRTVISLVEEKLLNALSKDPIVVDDDIVSAFIPKTPEYDYESLCNIFIQLAENRRRPTPLLKAASLVLSKTPRAEESNQANALLMISTLNSLIGLSYHNRPLIAKLMNDIIDTIKLEQHDSATHCNLLRSIGGLKWRPLSLLKLYYEYVQANHRDLNKVDNNFLLSLIYVTAQLNYRPELDLGKFYSDCMTPERENMIDKHSRKWLNHVWSLSILGIAKERHLTSVLNDEFIKRIETLTAPNPIRHRDMMKLLNLKAIAHLEFKLSNLESKFLDHLSKNNNIQRGSDMQKFAAKVHAALNGITKSQIEIHQEIQTPYGFVVDCEILLNEKLDLIPLQRYLEETIQLAEDGRLTHCGGQLAIEPRSAADSGNSSWPAGQGGSQPQQVNSNLPSGLSAHTNASHNCALIYVLFDEMIANSPNEVIGHKQVISRILKNLGYKTVFLPENLLNREKTSAGLSNKIKEIIVTTISGNDQ